MEKDSSTLLKDETVAVIGSGLIGRSWSMLFACAGYRVHLYDVDYEQVKHALDEIRVQLQLLQSQELPRGTLTVDQQCARISGAKTVQECLQGAFFIQECVPEDLDLKKKVWNELDIHVTGDVIMSSSSSSLLPSLISDTLKNKTRFIVSHPTNPPFYAPLVELIPAPWTDADVVSTTRALMEEIGQDPVVLKKEIDGFVLNRIQYSIFREGWNLIKDGVVSVADFDKVMSSGLGVRYAFIGPFEVAYLNADGFYSYCDRYADMIYRIQQSLGPAELMAGPTKEQIQQEMAEASTPLSELVSRRQWRDRRLTALSKLKKDMAAKDKQD